MTRKDDDLLKEFLVEGYENLDRLDRELVALEKDPSPATLASIFRNLHTIKGSCGFVGFGNLEALSHAAESLLSRLRDGEIRLTPPIANALLETVDRIRDTMAVIEATGTDEKKSYPALIDRLHRLQSEPDGDPAPARRSAEPAPAETNAVRAPAGPAVEAPTGPAGDAAPSASAPALAEVAPLPVAASAPAEVAAARGAAESPALPAPAPEPATATSSGDAPPAPHHPDGADARPTVSDGYVRVDVGLLDKLMNLVGELVLARNQIVQFVPTLDQQGLVAASQRLNIITTELQSGVMKTRMHPIRNVWDKFPRLVRDLALACGKQVAIDMEGSETELDKTIIEAIKDPLTHLVRNCVDHGIEAPETRRANGKPGQGRIMLRAFHEGGQVNIEVSDDGGGLNLAKIRDRALRAGLIDGQQAARFADRELQNLIFLPGFSTAEQISNISGRGVGMDVVKTNVERLGGVVDVQSRLGQGTTFRIKIPLTLAIIPALVVTSGGERYAIPQISLLELVRLQGEQARQGIEDVQGTAVYRLRGALLPLVHLDRELRGEGDEDTQGRPPQAEDRVNIVVLQADGRRFGLVVDQINDSEEIVVKPLGHHLQGISAFAGATIMGDGGVALILDVLGLAQRARIVTEVQARSVASASRDVVVSREDRRSLLLVAAGQQRLAIPLETVARLEEFPRNVLERTGPLQVVQYRGEILPLVTLATAVGEYDGGAEQATTVHVVVSSGERGPVGLVVDRILDIVDDKLEVQPTDGRPGVLGCAVIQDRVTDIVDVATVLASSASLGPAATMGAL